LGFAATASLEAPSLFFSLFEDAPVEAAASVPVVAGAALGAALGAGSPLDFFSASIPFFRPAEG
jgi:hypothetical protein